MSNISNDSSHPLIVFSIGGGYAGLSVADYLPFLEYLASNGYIVCAANADPLTAFQIGVSDETQAENLIVNYVSSSSFPLYNAVNLGAIGALGHSRGGDSVIQQAAGDYRIKVILGMGAANETDSMNDSIHVNVPAMLIFGSQDTNAPLSDNVNYYNNFGSSKEYIEINGAGHDLGIWNGIPYGFDYNLTTSPTTEKYVLSWFNYYLYSNSSALNVFSGSGLANDVSIGIIDKYSISGVLASAVAGPWAFTVMPQILSSTSILTTLLWAVLGFKPLQTIRNTLSRRWLSLGLGKTVNRD